MPAAVQMRLGSHPLHRNPSFGDPLTVQVMALYGPPTQVLEPPHVLPGQSVLIPHDSPMLTPPTHVPRQLPREPPPGATTTCSAPVVAVGVADGAIVGVLVTVGELVIVGEIVGELVGPMVA